MDENEIGTMVVDRAVKLHKSLGPVLLETVPLSPFISVPLCLREIPPSPRQTISPSKHHVEARRQVDTDGRFCSACGNGIGIVNPRTA